MPRTYKNIDDYLAATHTTQVVLARRLGITQSALSMIKNGDRIPRGKLALKIHKITGVPLARLLQRREGQRRQSAA